MTSPTVTADEEWRDIPGCASYQASSCGRIRRRIFGDNYHMISTEPTYGYLRAWIQGEDKWRTWQVSALVLITFVGPRPDGLQACHNDGNPVNNCVSNLRWASRKENAADRKKHGTETCGSRNGNSKLSEHDVLAIRASHESGETFRSIARRYGVSDSTVNRAINGGWKHVQSGASDGN